MSFIKKHYKAVTAGVVILLILLSMLNLKFIKTDGYSVDNVYNTIKELSSEKYKGRMYGTEENMEAARYVAEEFKKIGLVPGGDKDIYLSSYMLPTKKCTGMPVLELVDETGRVVKSYSYGMDFIENGRDFSAAGELTSGYGFVISGTESMEKTDANNQIAITKILNSSNTSKQYLYMQLRQAGYYALITVATDKTDLMKNAPGLGQRGLNKTGYEIPTLTVKERVSDELRKYIDKGYKLHLKTTIDVVNGPSADVIGYIPGKTQDTLLITSHIDHAGQLADGTIYPGALDNASGVSVMLELARYIKSQGKKPSKNIVFIAFNGEEAGAIGSQRYVRKPLFPLYRTTVLNFDMIGSPDNIPLTFMYYQSSTRKITIGNDPSSKLRYQLGKLAEDIGIQTRETLEPSSDHVYFNLSGISAVTLIDYDTAKIHTPYDDITNINKKNIDRALKLTMKYVGLTAYSNGVLNRENIAFEEIKSFLSVQYPLLIALLAAVIAAFIHYRIISKKTRKDKFRIPWLSIVIVVILTGIITYLPLRYPYAPKSIPSWDILLAEGIKSVLKAPIIYPLYIGYIAPGILAILIAKQRMQNWKYKGDGSEYIPTFYISMLLVVITSIIGNYLMYKNVVYYPVTPDFARGFIGKLVIHIIFAVIAYFVWKLARFEAGAKTKGYKSLTAFALIFFILLAAFYMPITINKYVMETNTQTLYGGQDINGI